MKRLPAVLLAAVGVLVPCASQGFLIVSLFPTDVGAGVYRFDVSVDNGGPADVVIVSLIDAPLGDPLIDPSLVVPAGFAGSYDPGLGIIDFLEDTELFAAGTIRDGFQFQTMASADDRFTSFEALTVDGDLLTGSTTVIPEPATLSLFAAGLAFAAAGDRRKPSARGR